MGSPRRCPEAVGVSPRRRPATRLDWADRAIFAALTLAAGNAVVFKPSEYTPGTGTWLVDTFAQVVPEQPVLQPVTGFGATGEALCRAGVDKIAFTGSAAQSSP